MGGKTLTRADLAEAVYRKVGLSRTESAELVEAVLDEICEAIVRGETVKLSSFATFHGYDPLGGKLVRCGCQRHQANARAARNR